MYKCIECGNLFEEGEQAVWYEDRGEFWGVPCSEKMTGCPKCHGEFDEATECEECGGWHFKEDLHDGLCENCLEETEDEE